MENENLIPEEEESGILTLTDENGEDMKFEYLDCIEYQEKEYLILLQTNNCWSFPKGHMEARETENQTALRELFEETGLRARLISDQIAVSEYDIPPYTRKQVVLFLGEVDGDVVLQETEVLNHKWVKASELKAYLHPDTYDACAELLR